MKKFVILFLFSSLILFSCSQRGDSKLESMASSPVSQDFDEGEYADSLKLVKTASINFKVQDVEQGMKAVAGLTAGYGGMVMSSTYQAREGNRVELNVSKDSILVISNYTPGADIIAQVPSEKLQDFLFEVAGLGYHSNFSSLQIDDHSLAYLRNRMRSKNRAALLKSSTSNTSIDSLALRKLSVMDEVTEQLIGNREIDRDVQYSRVSIGLLQNAVAKKEMIANYNLSIYKLPVAKRMADALMTGWDAFVNLLIGLAHLWVLGLIFIVGIFLYKQFRKRRLAAIIPGR